MKNVLANRQHAGERIAQRISNHAAKHLFVIKSRTIRNTFIGAIGFGALAVIVLPALLSFVLSPSGKAHAEATPDTCFTYTTSGSSATITDYSNDASCPRDVEIPNTLGEQTVTSIGNNAFANRQLTSVTIPDSVTSIGFGAFQINQLTSVAIPDSVTEIDTYAFGSNQITSLPLYFSQPSVTSIPDDIFDGNKIASLTIPNNITSIGDSAFYSNQLTSLTIPASVTQIGRSAFANNNLTSVYVAGNPTLDGYYTYEDADGVEHTANNTFAGNGGQAAIDACYNQHDDDNDNAALVACVQSHSNYIQVYAPNASADNDSLKDASDETYFYYYVDDNNNGWSVFCPAGGQILNPAQLTLHYVDGTDNNKILRDPDTYIGSNLLSYGVSANPNADFSRYYKAGQTITYDAPTIDGYKATGSSTQSIVLKAGLNDPTDPNSSNHLTFTYARDNGNGSGSSSHFAVPNTGTGDDSAELPVGCWRQVPVVNQLLIAIISHENR